MTSKIVLPAIRARVGDWNYYVTTLTFSEVADLIKAPDEVHERKRLADWIQREAIDKHASEVSTYILKTSQRFLGSIIVGVYGGKPDWTALSIKSPEEDLSEEQRERIDERLGLLHFTGAEKLFPIDSQHRVAGIKLAIKGDVDKGLLGESVSAIFVGHDPKSETGKVRTRRLFTTVNKKARVVGKAARIALDEDDGFAIVARWLIDFHKLFSDDDGRIAYSSSTGQIPATDQSAITSVVGLYELAKDLYGPPFPKGFDKARPSDEAIAEYAAFFSGFLDQLVNGVPELKKVLVRGEGSPGSYRTATRNHMLFRPAGQRAFCRATQLLLQRGLELKEAIATLRAVNLYIHKSDWHHILWDPVAETMITTKVSVAETQLLRLAGQPPRTKVAGKRLDDLLSKAS